MGNTLANVPLVEQGDESGLLVGGSSSKAGDKPIMGSIMEKVVEALNRAQQRQRSVEVSSKAQAAYVGEGLPPVPPKLMERIERGDFMEMCELIPEFWMAHKGIEEGPTQRVARSKGRKQSQNIYVWLQSYVVYVAVIAGKHPARISELMAYMILIIKASQEYEGLASFMYDEAFRRQAAATGLTEWSKINPSIFTECFNTRARSGTRCELCLTLGHDAEGCTRSEGEGDLALRWRTMEAALASPHLRSSERGVPPGYEATDACKLYNEGRCHYQPCKFRHVCRECKGDHPATAVPECYARVVGTPRALGPMRQNRSTKSRGRGFPY